MSLLQEIVSEYDRLETLNPYVKVRELRDEYLRTHSVEFKGDIIYSEFEWNKFCLWAIAEYGIDLTHTLGRPSSHDDDLPF